MLKLLPPKIEAKRPAHTAVMMPIVGVALAATAKDIDRGMDTSETVIPDFQLFFKLFKTKPMVDFIIWRYIFATLEISFYRAIPNKK